MTQADSRDPRPSASSAKNRTGIRVGIFVFLAAVAGLLYWQYGSGLSLQNLADRETQLRRLQQQSPWLVYSGAFAIYVTVTGLSLPGAAALSLAYAWYFGFRDALVLVSFASTTGATLAFLLSRFLFRDAVQIRFASRLKTFNNALERDGPFYLFTLRLIPVVPFFVINAVIGLTRLKTWTFWWISQLGMLPGTIVYVYAGSRVPNLQELADQGLRAVFETSQIIQIVVAFALLGLFPLAIRYVLRWMGVQRP